MGQAALINAYDQFMETARHYVDLRSEDDYQQALVALDMKRPLQRHSIEKLAERFGIRPAMFFGG